MTFSEWESYTMEQLDLSPSQVRDLAFWSACPNIFWPQALYDRFTRWLHSNGSTSWDGMPYGIGTWLRENGMAKCDQHTVLVFERSDFAYNMDFLTQHAHDIERVRKYLGRRRQEIDRINQQYNH